MFKNLTYLSRFEKGSAEPATSVPPGSKYQHPDQRNHASERTSAGVFVRQPPSSAGDGKGHGASPKKEGA